MKQNKIKGGIYKGLWCFDTCPKTVAKQIAHKQERAKSKKMLDKLSHS